MSDKSFYICGAGIVAMGAYSAIKKLYKCVPDAFLVSNLSGNPPEIEQIPVLEFSAIKVSDRDVKFLIAMPKIHHTTIANILYQLGAAEEQLIFMDDLLENKLMATYYRGLEEFDTVSEILCSDLMQTDLSMEQQQSIVSTRPFKIASEMSVFQAKSHVDRALKETVTIPEYVNPIQVGAALTDVVIANVQDNIGENISSKNRNYCELTATYYAWKNCHAKYKGVCHYRRIFELSDEQVEGIFAENDVDVILPYPSVHYPDIKVQHMRCINEGDWNAMLQALQEVAPDYYAAFEDVFSERYFYNYNMLIAKEEVFDDYSHFMFSVLERVEELTAPKGWERADRFAGYIGENLTTLYFRKNRDKLKIVHAGKRMLT